MKRTTQTLRSLWTLAFAAWLSTAIGPAQAHAQAAAGEFSEMFTLDATKYMGQWYEVARTPNDFEDNQVPQGELTYGRCTDSTAQYELENAHLISLTNSCTRAAIDGSGATLDESILGTALVVPDSAGRKLKIAFGDWLSQFFQRLFTMGGADYWVYGLGPQNDEGLYSWALVSGASRSNIFILARGEELDEATWAEVLALAEREGLPVDDLVFRSNAFEPEATEAP